MTDSIGVAFPKHDADRARLRQRLAPLPLPALYPNGVERPCARCGIPLDIGPRLIAAGLTVVCPLCIAAMLSNSEAVHVNVQNLGNPDSTWEDES